MQYDDSLQLVEEYVLKSEMTLRELDELYGHLVDRADVADRLSLNKLFAQQIDNSNSALNKSRNLLAEGWSLDELTSL